MTARLVIQHQLQSLILGLRQHQLGDIVGRPLQIKTHRRQLHLPSFNLGKIQDIVDYGKQSPSGVDDGFRELSLLSIQLGTDQQFRHPQYPIHGGTNLMTHGCQECALGPGTSLRLLFGFNQGETCMAPGYTQPQDISYSV